MKFVGILQNLRQRLRSSLNVVLLAGMMVGSSIAPATAAEELVVTYGAFQASFTLRDLERLANTGDVSNSIGFYLELAGVAPEDLRAALTTEVKVSHHLLDNLLNTEGGEYVLSEITQVVHTPSRQANIQALRSAFIMAAKEDQQVSLLELLQHYPTRQVFVNGGNLIQLARDLNAEPSVELGGGNRE
ncbi:alpha/beta hydrolase [Thermocoleostomius sinensis]|uniref:Alpha/beta hydrolase n=1 Tax=Thermocoleostomius sinensis A174 TaxID=2016057 RepID=A0A9E9C6E7_9CYAN|nr:alpha/beta hydrolase [Thermocoleostomius sinensis]WAL58098.1 alpha/beta hydrolase [Thermocoleostomius sinensis A174]